MPSDISIMDIFNLVNAFCHLNDFGPRQAKKTEGSRMHMLMTARFKGLSTAENRYAFRPPSCPAQKPAVITRRLAALFLIIKPGSHLHQILTARQPKCRRSATEVDIQKWGLVYSFRRHPECAYCNNLRPLLSGETFLQASQFEHGNGNHFDDSEGNLDLACPGCHATLTAYDLLVGVGHRDDAACPLRLNRRLYQGLLEYITLVHRDA